MPSSARRLPLRGCKLPIPPSVDPIPGVVYALRGHIERRDVLFVGLTELWNLSVCAFHRQLGGTPQPAEFAPSRQYNGTAKGSSRYFASELPGYYDEYDEYVYEWARSRFVRDVSNLSGWRCAMERWEDGDRLACAE